VRVEPAGAALLIFQLGRLDGALPRADAADAPETTLRVAGCALLNDQPTLAVRVLDETRRPIAIFRVSVLAPQLGAIAESW
jgi:hypothetical protein